VELTAFPQTHSCIEGGLLLRGGRGRGRGKRRERKGKGRGEGSEWRGSEERGRARPQNILV